MTYYYLAADGSTGGPETLQALTGMVAGGAVGLATLVVPAGGEDWTPLARVLRYFYSDAAGATAGPVAFSELQRLNQTGVIDGGAWVLEEGAEQWKTLESVITAGGAEVYVPAPVAAPAPAPGTVPRTATGAYRPPGGRTQAVAGGDPYAAPRSGPQKVLVRHRGPRGIARGPFFLVYLLMLIIDFAVVVGFVQSKFSEPFKDYIQFWEAIAQYLVLLISMFFITAVVTSLLTFFRLRNIGWSVSLMGIHILFFASLFLPASVKQSKGGGILMLALLGIAFLLFALLLIMPAGFAKHRRFDTAAKLNAVIIPLVTAGLIYGGYEFSKRQERKYKEFQEKKEKEAKEAATPKLQP